MKYPFRAHVPDTSVGHSIALHRYSCHLRSVPCQGRSSIIVCSLEVRTDVCIGTFLCFNVLYPCVWEIPASADILNTSIEYAKEFPSIPLTFAPFFKQRLQYHRFCSLGVPAKQVCMRGTCASPLPISRCDSGGIHSLRVVRTAKAKPM